MKLSVILASRIFYFVLIGIAASFTVTAVSYAIVNMNSSKSPAEATTEAATTIAESTTSTAESTTTIEASGDNDGSGDRISGDKLLMDFKYFSTDLDEDAEQFEDMAEEGFMRVYKI